MKYYESKRYNKIMSGDAWDMFIENAGCPAQDLQLIEVDWCGVGSPSLNVDDSIYWFKSSHAEVLKGLQKRIRTNASLDTVIDYRLG